MARNVLIIDGHPDPSPERLCRYLCAAASDGATRAGHTVRRIVIAECDFPLVRTAEEFETFDPPPIIAAAQSDLEWANHVILVFPIWLGTLPALTKAFLEQALRPGFARERDAAGGILGRTRMNGRSVRIVATMGMPALAYQLYFGGHGLANLSHNVLGFVGFRPVRSTLFGGIADVDARRVDKLGRRMRALGQAAR